MIKSLLSMAVLALLIGCGESQEPEKAGARTIQKSPAARTMDPSQVARGGVLYRKNCAECHGENGEGAPNWRQRDSDGMFPPPPLNGTGHAWHHPRPMLHYVIANGSPGGQGKMPAWKEKLNSEQINDVIVWFMSRWPDEVYQAWYQMNQRAAQGG